MTELTKQFLESIDVLFPNTCFYRMPDIKEEGKKSMGAIPIIDRTKVDTYNNNQNKFGIFFTPNGDFSLTNSERKKDNAKNAYCFFYDIDEKIKTREEIEYEPSIIIETMRGYHVYWLLDEPMQDISIWEEIQDAVVSLCSGDEKAKDIARIMRLPGKKYWKDNKGEFVPEVIHFKPENRYSVNDFNKFASTLSNAKIKEETTRRDVGRDSWSVVDEIDRRVDVVDVLYDLGGTIYEVLKNNSIKINGELTSGYKKHPSKNFLLTFSPHDDRPTGGPFSVAKFFLKNHHETFKYFRDKYGVGEVRNYSVAQNINKISEEGKGADYGIDVGGKYSIPIKKGEIIFDYDDCCIYRIVGSDKFDVLSGVIESLGFYTTDDNRNVYIVKYKSKLGETGVLEFVELGRSGEMERKLSEVGITFFGTANDKKTIIDAIHSVRQHYQFINKLGVYSKTCIVNKSGRYIINNGKERIFVNINDMSPADRSTDEVIKIEGDGTLDSVIKTIEKLREMYYDPIAITFFVAYIMGFLSYTIRNIMNFLPAIILCGLTQSGKTKLREAMMDIFGIDKALNIQAGTTEFILMKKSTHYAPLNIGEYKNSDTKFDWAGFVKNNYDGTKNARGRSNQSTELYEANSQLIVDGESQMMHNSVYSRTYSFFMNPKYKKRLIKFDNINRFFVENLDKLSELSSKYKLHREYVSEEFIFVDKQDKDRIVDNYALLLALADVFGFLEYVKDDIMEQANIQMEMIGEDNVDKLVKSVMSMAKDGKFVCEFDDETMTLRIDVVIDELRYPEARIADLRSQIQTTNHHFMGGNGLYISKESLYIPLSYLKKNRGTHMMFNMILNHICKNTEIPQSCLIDILDYAKKYGHTKQFFYDYRAPIEKMNTSYEDAAKRAKEKSEGTNPSVG